MFRFVVSNENRFLRLYKLPLGKYFFLFNIKYFHIIRNPETKEYFLSQFVLPNKTLKSTRRVRFEDLDQAAVKYLNNRETSAIHDIAVSDGLTSLQFYKIISGITPGSQFYVSDKFSKIYVSAGCVTRVFSSDLNLMHFYLFNLIYADNKISNYFFLSKILFYILKFFSPAKSLPEKQMLEISLYDKEVIAALRDGKLYELNYDILASKVFQKFTFVRAMNILNRVYFSENEIILGLKNIMYSLKEKGILLTGRTSKGINHATFYQKINSRLVILENVNQGSDINDFVNQINKLPAYDSPKDAQGSDINDPAN